MNDNRAQIIALMGIDGAGKTTQARHLADWLSSLGVGAVYHRSEGGRSELDRLARQLGKGDFGELIGRESAGWAQAVIRWRSIRAAADILARPGTFVVMDRYLSCQYAAAHLQGLPNSTVRRMFAEFPAPDLELFLDLDPALATDRVERRGLDSDSVDLLAALAAAYRGLPEFPGFTVVDASRTPAEVELDIRRHVARAYPAVHERTKVA